MKNLVDCVEHDRLRRSYFPDSDSARGLDPFTLCQYVVAADAMEEPPLPPPAGATDSESVRFVWLRSFHPAIGIRVERDGGDVTLVSRVLAGEELGGPATTETRHLQGRAWRDISALLAAMDFWQAPPAGQDEGLDGANWFLEVRCADQHRIIHRWSPQADGPHSPFREACLHLVRLSNLGQLAEPVY